MKSTMKKTALSIALTTALLGGATWSTASHACADQPYLTAVCIMAASNLGNFAQTYVPAQGQILALTQYQAVYSLVGNTYGGDGRTTFGLPDLRGRMVIGAGQGPGMPSYPVGFKGGNYMLQLTTENLPAHSHTLAVATVNTSKMTASTSLAGLSATLSGTAKLKAVDANATATSPVGNSLATTASLARPVVQSQTYAATAPTVVMNSGSIDTSGLTVAIAGNAATTLGGNATLAGNTDISGSSASLGIMNPFMAMTYYIALNNGLYPPRD